MSRTYRLRKLVKNFKVVDSYSDVVKYRIYAMYDHMRHHGDAYALRVNVVLPLTKEQKIEYLEWMKDRSKPALSFRYTYNYGGGRMPHAILSREEYVASGDKRNIIELDITYCDCKECEYSSEVVGTAFNIHNIPPREVTITTVSDALILMNIRVSSRYESAHEEKYKLRHHVKRDNRRMIMDVDRWWTYDNR